LSTAIGDHTCTLLLVGAGFHQQYDRRSAEKCRGEQKATHATRQHSSHVITKGTLLGTMHVKSWITPCGLLSTQRTFLFRDRLIFPHLTSEEQIHARLVPPASSTPPRFRPLTANKLNFQTADSCACCTTCDTTPDAASLPRMSLRTEPKGPSSTCTRSAKEMRRVPLHFLQFRSRLTPRSAFHNSSPS
jgi:hypothetical protein